MEMDQEFFYELDDLMSRGEFEEVIDRINELDEDEQSPELRIMLAHALTQCGRCQEALEILQDYGEEASYDDMGYHLELAGVYFGLHYYSSAEKEAKICLEIDENCVDAWIMLSMIYQDMGDDEKFEYASEKARELDEQAWESIYGETLDQLFRYTPEDLEKVSSYIKEKFGEKYCSIPYQKENGKKTDHPVDVIVTLPDQDRDFYSVITLGFGAYPACFLDMDGNPHTRRTEIAVFLPPELSISEVTSSYSWIAMIMRQFSEMIESEGSNLGYGHSISYGDRLDDSVEYDGVIFDTTDEDLIGDDICLLSDGSEVQFLQMRPLYEEELMYKIEKGHDAMFDRLIFSEYCIEADGQRLSSEKYPGIKYLKNQRVNCCAEDGRKKWAIPRSGMIRLLDWNGADGCFATDRITVDKCRVGVMYRERPYPSQPDSGWRFLAGDEDEEYMSDTSNMDIFNLNTICNYDPAIIEYLNSPVGSVYCRDRSGSFVKIESFGTE